VHRLALFPKLRTLNISDCTIRSLAGIPALPALHRLRIINCRQLTSLDGVQGSATLAHIAIDGSPGLTDVSAWRQLPNKGLLLGDAVNLRGLWHP
jgi:hypothetical protein